MHTNIGNHCDNWNSLSKFYQRDHPHSNNYGRTCGGRRGSKTGFYVEMFVGFSLFSCHGDVNGGEQDSTITARGRTAKGRKIVEEIQTMLAIRYSLTKLVVDYMVERILALDKAYPLLF